MRTADDVFPRVPRPSPPFKWRVAAGFLAAGVSLIGQHVALKLSGWQRGEDLVSTVVYHATTFGVFFGCLAMIAFGWMLYQWHTLRVWRTGRIEPAALTSLTPTVWWYRLPYRTFEYLVSWLPKGIGLAVILSRTTVEVHYLRNGRACRAHVRASVHNFRDEGNPGVVWLITPRRWLAKPRLLADVAPRDWAWLAVPPDIEAAFLAKVATAQAARQYAPRPKAVS